MIYIKKERPPECVEQELSETSELEEWKNISESDIKAMRNVFNNLRHKEKIRQALLEEQHHICAYCMKRIENKSLHMTIEHYVPLSKCKSGVLDYQNYLGVCKGGSDLPREKQTCLCCDASKGDMPLRALNPFNEKQMENIKYLSSGEIYYERQPQDRDDFVKDIEEDLYATLRLNGTYDKENKVTRRDTRTSLVKNRKDVYESCEEYLQELYEQGQLNQEKLCSDIQTMKAAEQYEEYIGVRLFLLKQTCEQLARDTI